MHKFKQYMDYNIQVARVPLSFWHLFIILAAVVFEITFETSMWRIVLAGCLVLLYNTIHWYSNNLIKVLKNGYFAIQGSILYGCALLLPEGSPFILLGLMPVLILHTLYYFNNLYKNAVFIVTYYVLYCVTISYNLGLSNLPVFMILFIAVLGIAIFVITLFNKEVLARKRLEKSLIELAEANQQIEKLTIANERHRIARDLHDNLTQHLAGLILQLDAADAHLDQQNLDKAHAIIKKAMSQAELSLDESRNVVSNLRSFDTMRTWESRLKEEIQHFQCMAKILVFIDAVQYPMPSATTIEHSIAIIREVLHNIQKHAHATEVNIVVNTEDTGVYVVITDNGIGYDVESALQLEGHFGLLGMQERIKLIHGTITYTSTEDGTTVKFLIPLKEHER